jgi:hypothetical protein
MSELIEEDHRQVYKGIGGCAREHLTIKLG